MNAAPRAPGKLGERIEVLAMRDYLDQLQNWLTQRRAELDEIDQAIVANQVNDLTSDIMLAMMLWKSATDRVQLLSATWDGGRVGPSEQERLSALVWGRMDATLDPSLLGSATLASKLGAGLAVSLPEACRLSDVLVQQLRMRLALHPAADEHSATLKQLRAQMERLRDQIGLEPADRRPALSARLSDWIARLEQITAKAQRGGDVGGLLGPIELEAARLERDLIVGGARRREAENQLSVTRDRVAELSAREAGLRALATRCVRLVAPAPRYAVPEVAALGPIPDSAAALAQYTTRLQRVDAAMTLAQAAYTQALAERDALSAEFATLRADATRDQLDQRADVVRADALVSDWLARTPTPLRLAQHVVQWYRQVVQWERDQQAPASVPRPPAGDSSAESSM